MERTYWQFTPVLNWCKPEANCQRIHRVQPHPDRKRCLWRDWGAFIITQEILTDQAPPAICAQGALHQLHRSTVCNQTSCGLLKRSHRREEETCEEKSAPTTVEVRYCHEFTSWCESQSRETYAWIFGMVTQHCQSRSLSFHAEVKWINFHLPSVLTYSVSIRPGAYLSIILTSKKALNLRN